MGDRANSVAEKLKEVLSRIDLDGDGMLNFKAIFPTLPSFPLFPSSPPPTPSPRCGAALLAFPLPFRGSLHAPFSQHPP